MENINVKSFRVLCIEDENLAREKLGKFLDRKFDKVSLCADGVEGYMEFQKAKINKEPYDLIISDIDMPKMDGIEMLEKIRELDSSVPFIFVTARAETKQMIKAINLHADSYILKPLDLNIIESILEKVSQDIYYKKTYAFQKSQTQKYIDILNQEAIVSRTDLNGIITFVNDAFCEVSGYTQKELIGKNHSIVRHPDTPKNVFKELWQTIQVGNIWEGVLKEKTKDGSDFFLSSKIMPIFDISGENIIEYIGVRFLVTDTENKKRSHQRKVIEQITEYKKTISTITQEKDQLLNKIDTLSNSILNFEDLNKAHEVKKKQLLDQISAYESSKLELNKIELMTKQDKHKQFEIMRKSVIITQGLNRKLENKLKEMQKQFKNKMEELDAFIAKDLENLKRIEDLKDLVNNLQKENKKLTEDKKKN